MNDEFLELIEIMVLSIENLGIQKNLLFLMVYIINYQLFLGGIYC